MSAIQTRGLTKTYRGASVVDRLDLDVSEGQVYGFLGPNGAGKTTTVRMLLGLARPTSGHAWVLGHDIQHDRPAAMRGVGYLPDVPHFPPWMTAPDVLDAAGRYHGLAPSLIRTRSRALLDMAGLATVTTRVGGYSRGMTQRLGLARALVNAPKLLVLDEPTSAVDPAGRRDVLDLIHTLAGRTTVLMSTHILDDVQRVCDHVAILDHGHLLIQAPTRALLERHATPRIQLVVTDPHHTGALTPLHADLASEAWLTSITDDADPGCWTLTVTDPSAAGQRIPLLVAQHGLGLQRLEHVTPSLEDVFLDLVTTQKAA